MFIADCYNWGEKKMRKDYATKTIIIHILFALKKYTSQEHPVSYTELARFLQGQGRSCDRKTVARNVDYLIKDGFAIGKTDDGKCYYSK